MIKKMRILGGMALALLCATLGCDDGGGFEVRECTSQFGCLSSEACSTAPSGGKYCTIADGVCESGRRWTDDAERSLATVCMAPSIEGLVAMPAMHDFGTVAPMMSSAWQDIVIRNQVNYDVKIVTALLGGTDSPAFTIVEEHCTGKTLPAGTSCTIVTSYRAPSIATHTAQVMINGSAIATLRGDTVEPVRFTITPTSHDYGPVSTSSSTNRGFYVTNTGQRATMPLTVTLTGVGFVKDSDTCTGNPLMPSGVCDISIRFAPTTVGTMQGELVISAVTTSLRAQLQGSGVSP